MMSCPMAAVERLVWSLFFLVAVSSLECPTPFGPPGGEPDDALTNVRLNLYLDEADFADGVLPARRVDLITSSRVQVPFDSLEILQLFSSRLPSIPASLSNATVRLELESANESPLYFSAGVWSLDSKLAPPACAEPSLLTIAPGQNTSIFIRLPCAGVGTVFMQFCLSIGTEPFHLLNGTYQMFTVFFPRTCEGERTDELCNIDSPNEIVHAELCVTVNETVSLVNYGAGRWSVLLGIFRDDPDSDRGYCFIDRRVRGGVTPVITNDETSRNFFIPQAFNELDIYVERSPSVDDDTAISFAVSFTSGNKTVLNDPVANIPLSGILPLQRIYVEVAMPCKAQGFTRVYISFNTTALKDEILYRRDFNIYYYRNCTPRAVARQPFSRERLGVLIGVPIAVLLVFLAGIVGVVVAILLFLTRRQKRRHYELEQQIELSKLPTSNAYISSTFANPFAFLDGYGIEYNYASLEVIEELGQGAFGRVFKARAPGIRRGDFVPREFVAVKTLKEEAETDVIEDFCKEVKVCVQFEHANIVRLVGVCTASANKCMIFEFMDLGNLGELLRISNPENPAHPGSDSGKTLITTDKFLLVVVQVASGMVYLANLKFVHRDIAARNCLINSNFTVKIADFGMSREVSGMDYYRIGSQKASLPVRWMPPEALIYGKFTLKSDVWSFGVLTWEVYAFGRQPYSGASNYEVIDRIKEGRLLECPAHCPTAIFDIMKSCWYRSPVKRATMTTVLQRLSHLAQVSAVGERDSYIALAPAEGYLNLTFGEAISDKELANSRDVEAKLKEKQDKELADIAELLADSEDEDKESNENINKEN